MRVSTRGRYSLRVMLDLAANDTGEYIPLRDIAHRQDITIKYLEQIITLLHKAGYLRSLRGSGGGYRLAKPPAEYVVGDILRAAEGSLAPLACLEGTEPCDRGAFCPTQPFWQGLYRVITAYVDGVTLADLLEQSLKNREPDYSI
jgi:Rrf2 family protein